MESMWASLLNGSAPNWVEMMAWKKAVSCSLACPLELSVLLLECRSDLMTALKWVEY
jgi:hypothetical protein